MSAIPLSVDHCTASVYQVLSPTSPYPATAPAGDGNPTNNADVNAKTNPTVNQEPEFVSIISPPVRPNILVVINTISPESSLLWISRVNDGH